MSRSTGKPCLIAARGLPPCRSCLRDRERCRYLERQGAGKCVRCGREDATRGVLGPDCHERHRQRNEVARNGKPIRRPPVCHVCWDTGHFAKTCPRTAPEHVARFMVRPGQ